MLVRCVQLRDLVTPAGTDPTLPGRILAGLGAGLIGISFAQPTDLVKVCVCAVGTFDFI